MGTVPPMMKGDSPHNSPPTFDTGYSDAPNGASRASSAKLIATMANVVTGGAGLSFLRFCDLSVSER